MNKDIPRINPILATFEPVMFPSTKAPALDLIAEMEVKSSGADVATETIVSPTIIGGIPIFFAKIEQLSESKSPPLVKKNNPKTEHPTKKVIKPIEENPPMEEPQISNNSCTKEEVVAILRHNHLQGQSKVVNQSLT